MPVLEREADANEQLEDHLNELKNIDEAERGERRELINKTTDFLNEGGLESQKLGKLRKVVGNMSSKGKLNTNEARKIRNSAIDNLGHEFSNIKNENTKLLDTFAGTHPDLIKEKSRELSNKVPVYSSNERVAKNAVDLVTKMKGNDLLKEKDFKNIVQGATNKITAEGSIIETVARGKEEATTFLDELAKGDYLKQDHFEKGELEELREKLEKEKNTSIIGEISRNRGHAPAGETLLANLKEMKE